MKYTLKREHYGRGAYSHIIVGPRGEQIGPHFDEFGGAREAQPWIDALEHAHRDGAESCQGRIDQLQGQVDALVAAAIYGKAAHGTVALRGAA